MLTALRSRGTWVEWFWVCEIGVCVAAGVNIVTNICPCVSEPHWDFFTAAWVQYLNFWTVSWDRLTAWKQGRSTEWWINNGRRCLLQEYQISNIGSPEMWPLPVRSLRKQRLSAPKKLNWWSKSKTLRTSFLSRKFIPRNVLFMS